MPSHKFKVGDIVTINPAISRFVPGGVFEVIKQLPGGDEPEYRIKSANEPHERVARESELSKAEGRAPMARSTSTPSNLHLAFRKADLPTALIRDLNQFLVVFLAAFLANSNQHRRLGLFTNRLHEHESPRELCRAKLVIAGQTKLPNPN